MDLIGKLADIIGLEDISATAETLARYSIDGHLPQAVVYPWTVKDLAEVLHFADREGLKVAPAGAGTKLAIGNIPERVDLVISTKRLNQVIEYEPADLTAVVSAGCSWKDFYRITSQNGQFVPIDPLGSDEATLGGIISTNSYGPLRLFYGAPRDYVIGIKVAHADGTLTKGGGKVVKNVAGYDMNKLYVGALGTLGIVTEMAFKLRPIPQSQATSQITSDDLGKLCLLIGSVLNSQLLPHSIELVDGRSVRVLDAHAGGAPWTLFVRFGEGHEAVEYQLSVLEKKVQEIGRMQIERMSEREATRLWQSVRSFEELFCAQLVIRVSIRKSRLQEAVVRCDDLLRQAELDYALLAHAGDAVVRLYVRGLQETEENIGHLVKIVKDLREYVRLTRGSVVISRAPVALKRVIDVWGLTGETASIMRAIKESFDPRHTLNPGRYIVGI